MKTAAPQKRKFVSFKKLSIQQRLPFFICMLLLAVVVAFSWISYISVEKASMAIGSDRVTTLADKLSLMFKSSVDQFASTVNTVASGKSVKAFLTSPNKADSLSSLETIREFMKKDTTNKLMQILNARGKPVLSAGGPVAKFGVNPDSLITPASPKAGAASVGKFVVLNRLIYFPTLAKVTDSTKIIGYLVDWKLMRGTQKSIDQLAQLLGANGRLYFGNDDGHVWTDLIKPVERPPVEPVKLQGVAEYTRANGYPVIASMRKIPDSRWLVLIELSNASFQQTSQIYLRWVTLIGLLLIVAGSVGGWLMSRNITKPLNQLSRAAAAIADGNYSTRVNIEGDDELGKLAGSFNIMAARVRDAQQELEHMVQERTRELQTAITDIKDQKETDRKKDEFISIASHELKTPLTTLKAFFQLAGREIPPQLKSYNFIGNASRQLNRMERLIADLLDVSKINAGKMQYDFEEFNFDLMLRDTVANAQQISPGHKLIVERSAPVIVNGDRHRLEQVIVNLLSNAVKYSPEADKVVIWSKPHGDKLQVTIKDYGIGISKKNINELFDRYYRIDGSEYRFQGLGLGLFISSEIIKRHGGSIWVKSEPGNGSEFIFELPV